jgi:surfeit locus 1 family protein
MGRELIVILATLAGVALTGRLGWWQLDRAAQKLDVQAKLEARADLPPLDGRSLARDASAAEAQQYRKAVVSGRWLADRTLFLDNRPMEGKVGFIVLTPLALDDGAAVVVQRGWVPRDFIERTSLPAVQTTPERATVEGTIALNPPRLFEFAATASGPIRQNLDLPAFARESGLALLPVIIVQREGPGGSADGLQRRWPAPAADVQKHHGYAFQWFALAAVIITLYVWHRLIRPRFRRP